MKVGDGQIQRRAGILLVTPQKYVPSVTDGYSNGAGGIVIPASCSPIPWSDGPPSRCARWRADAGFVTLASSEARRGEME